MKVVIAGTRYLAEYAFLERKVNKILKNYVVDGAFKDITYISGGCGPMDCLGDVWAKSYDIPIEQYRADTRKEMTQKMLKKADVLIIFWNGEEPTAQKMIDAAYELDITTRIIEYQP